MINNLSENKRSTAYPGFTASRPDNPRTFFTYKTGQVLETIGQMFLSIPPFNDHINSSTGRLLISLGRKLKK